MSRPALREVESPRATTDEMASENGGRWNGGKPVALAILLTALGTGAVQWGFSSGDDLSAMRAELSAGLKEINGKLEAQGRELAGFRAAYGQNEKHVETELTRMREEISKLDARKIVMEKDIAYLKARLQERNQP